MKIRGVGAELCYVWKDGRIDMTKSTVAFSNFANAHKDLPWEHSRRLEEI